MNQTFAEQMEAALKAMPDDVLKIRIAESEARLKCEHGLMSFAAGLLLPLLQAEQQRRESLR